MTRLIALYPRWWRNRYGDEMRALLESAPNRPRDPVDLARGALDAWLHPPNPSRLPALAALLGGGLWTVAAARVIAQPVPPDWPGYLEEIVLMGLVAVGCLLVAVVGVALRVADSWGRSLWLAVGLAVAGYLGWVVALAGTASGAVDSVTLWAAQATAMIATAAVGTAVVRAGDDAVGGLVILAAAALLIPWAGTWLVFGACWTAIGMILLVERSGRLSEGRGTP